MMSSSLLLTAFWTARPVLSFVVPALRSSERRNAQRLFASSSAKVSVENNVSRLSTLQNLLSKHGAPGSETCQKFDDLVPVTVTGSSLGETSELVANMSGDSELSNLHPYLFPIAKSKSSGSYICGYRNPFVEESDQKLTPWPIVESKVGGPGFQLIALNSEHLMRRIACEGDITGDQELVDVYNAGLGEGKLDPLLDSPYEAGSVEKLGYGVDKFVLLRVGPFADLYQSMSMLHKDKGDEQSSLIAAEAANGKLAGFGSNFRFYARLLSTFPNRNDETRDAARMCLRLPLTTIGMSQEDFKEVAVLAQLADPEDDTEVAFAKLRGMYDKMREAEKEEDGSKTAEQAAIDDATLLIDKTVLAGGNSIPWSSIREELGDIFLSINREEMAAFVDAEQ